MSLKIIISPIRQAMLNSQRPAETNDPLLPPEEGFYWHWTEAKEAASKPMHVYIGNERAKHMQTTCKRYGLSYEEFIPVALTVAAQARASVTFSSTAEKAAEKVKRAELLFSLLSDQQKRAAVRYAEELSKSPGETGEDLDDCK